jgi:hypothetical protein
MHPGSIPQACTPGSGAGAELTVVPNGRNRVTVDSPLTGHIHHLGPVLSVPSATARITSPNVTT